MLVTVVTVVTFSIGFNINAGLKSIFETGFKARDKDRYKIDTQKLDFSTTNFSTAEIETQNRDLVKHADEFLTDPESGWEVFLEAV